MGPTFAEAVMTDQSFLLDTPRSEWLASYAEALERGWSRNNVGDVSGEQLAALRADPVAFLEALTEQTGTVTLPDGSTRQRLPSITLWMWDGAFCGTISLRWQLGTHELP